MLAALAAALTLTASQGGMTVDAELGSFCHMPPGEAALCADSSYPLPVEERLAVRPQRRIVVRTSVRARTLRARLLDVDGSTIQRVGRRPVVRRLGPRRWAVRPRGGLRRAEALDVFIRWDNARDGRGDADFWAGVRRAAAPAA